MVEMFSYLQQFWNKTVDEMLEIDERVNLLHYLRSGYDYFHMYGEQALIDAIKEDLDV